MSTDTSVRIMRRLAAALAAGAVAAAAGSATADVFAAWSAPDQWIVEVTHVPDLDQRRTFLPGGGSNYCAPTSAINWMTYFANHGLPWISPGPGWWQSQSRYEDGNWAMYFMGLDMNCSATGGTSGDGTVDGLADWLYGQPFVITGVWGNSAWSPQVADMATAVFSGGYVIAGVGWYEELGGGNLERHGGHALSLTYAAQSGISMAVGWRDPWSDEGDHTQQAPFSTETYGVQPRWMSPVPGWSGRWMSKILGYGSGYIDGYVAIHPTVALSPQTDYLGLFVIQPSLTVFGAQLPALLEIPSPEALAVTAEAIHPDLLSYIVITESGPGESKLWRVDAVTGETEQLEIDVANARAVLVGRRRGLYVLDGDDLVLIEIDVPGPPEEIARITPPSPIAALTYDDALDQLVLLSVANREWLEYPWHLDAIPAVRPIPATVPLAGQACISWNHAGESAMVLSEASDAFYELWVSAASGQVVATEIAHASLVSPTHLAVGDAGNVFVCTQQQLMQFMKPVGAGWMPAPEPWFNGAPVGDRVAIARSGHNWDFDVFVGPDWLNEPPQEVGAQVYDCIADVNHDGAVDVGDLLAVLAAWGPCPDDAFCHEDVDYSGDVNVVDLLEVLGSWGACD